MPEPKTAAPTPSGGQLWKILRGGPPETKKIEAGEYDKVAAELYDMARRHQPSMIDVLAQRLSDLGIEVPPDEEGTVTPKDPKPFTGLGKVTTAQRSR